LNWDVLQFSYLTFVFPFSQFIKKHSGQGFSIEVEDLKDLVAHWLNVRERETAWTGNRPQAAWVGSFVKRHHLDLTVRRTTIKTFGEACVTEERLRKFMERLKVSLFNEETGLPLDDDCILNMDETSLHWDK